MGGAGKSATNCQDNIMIGTDAVNIVTAGNNILIGNDAEVT